MTDISNAFATSQSPGTVDPFSLGMLGQNTGLSELAMHNRYQQLGLGQPSGGSPQGAAASGSNLQYGGPGTAEQMDTGALPSLVGGIPGMAGAALGQMETTALSQPTTSASTGGGKGSGLFGFL